MLLSLIIPMYNEDGIIANTCEQLITNSSFNKGLIEVIIVNDGSRDKSAEIVKKYCGGHFKLISYEKNRGKGFAVKTGVLEAHGDIIAYTDADLAYGLDIINEAIKCLNEKNCDIVIGNRHLIPSSYNAYTLSRRAASKTFSFILNSILNIKISDTQCGIKVMKRKAAKDIFSHITTDGYAFDLEVLTLAKIKGYRIEEIPAVILKHEKSNVSLFRDSYRTLRDAIKIKNTLSKHNKSHMVWYNE